MKSRKLHLKPLGEFGYFRTNNNVFSDEVDKIHERQHSRILNQCWSIDDFISKIKCTDFIEKWLRFLQIYAKRY